MAKLGELASLIRSKNAGPFLMTIDIMFDDPATFEAVRRSGVITRGLIARTYGMAEEDIRLVEYPPGLAIKITVPRAITSGDPLDTDIYAAQQHGPLVVLEVPVDLAPMRAADR